MIQGFIAGNLGRDAELKSTQGGPLCSFSVAVEQRTKGEKVTTWIRCALFGKRGEALVPHLKKGSRVAVAGELTLHEHNGKTSLDLRVSEVTLMGGGTRGATKPPAGDDGSYDGPDYGAKPSATDDDPLPF